MIKIDLLKGQGLPIRSKPAGIAFVTIACMVPLFIVIAMFCFYMNNKILIAVQKKAIINFDKDIANLSEELEFQKSFHQQKDAINSNLAQAEYLLAKHNQWSHVLVTLVEHMPRSLVLIGLKTKENHIIKRTPQKDKPEHIIVTSIPVQTLQLNICNRSSSSDDKMAIKKFKDNLRNSEFLGSKLDDIIVSQGISKLGQQDVVSYQISCVFKPRL